MKKLASFLFVASMIIGLVFHIWTVVIAISNGGFLSGFITFILPVFSEIYWMVKMWGENDPYTTLGIISFVPWVLYFLMSLFVGSSD